MNEEERLRALMIEYQSGSPAAFEDLYALLARPLNGYLMNLCRDRATSDELLQETFLQLHRSRHTYRPDAPLKPWAYAIARHVFQMHRRMQRSRVTLEGAAHGELERSAVTAGFEPAVDARRSLSQALGSLSKDRRRAVLLHHVLGLSFEEIATKLGIKSGAAKVRASRGMAALRAVLGHKEGP